MTDTKDTGKYQGEILAKWRAQGGGRYELTAYQTGPKPLIVLFRVSVTGKYKVADTWVAREIYNAASSPGADR